MRNGWGVRGRRSVDVGEPLSRPLRAVLYARVSRDDGEQDPAVQLQALQEWAGVRGWRVVAQESDRITGDPARRNGDPPGLRKALSRIQCKKADVLAVFAADRLVRSPVGLIQLVSRVQSLGGHVASLQDGADLDTTSDLGELFLFLKGWFARMELRLLRSRTLAGLARAKAKGTKLGRRRNADAPDPAHVAHLRESGQSWTLVAGQLGCHPSAARRAFARLVENGGSGEADPSVDKHTVGGDQ